MCFQVIDSFSPFTYVYKEPTLVKQPTNVSCSKKHMPIKTRQTFSEQWFSTLGSWRHTKLSKAIDFTVVKFRDCRPMYFFCLTLIAMLNWFMHFYCTSMKKAQNLRYRRLEVCWTLTVLINLHRKLELTKRIKI